MATFQTALTKFTAIDGLKVAYRRFGKPSTFPLLYINHLRGSMDTLDPLLFNSIAKNREVIIYDSFGIGHSEGTVPDSTDVMAFIAAKFLAAIDVSVADVMGFSMGGGVAQILAWDYPKLVHKLILAGTQSAIGEAVVLPPREVLEGAGANNDEPPTKEDMLHLFFYPSESSLATGSKWWERIHERKVEGEERRGYLVGQGARSQLTAIFSFTVDTDNFDRLKDIKAPTLVTNGHTDIMSPTPNSFVLQQRITNAQLIIYPDAGHGHLFQFPELYAKHLELFLAEEPEHPFPQPLHDSHDELLWCKKNAKALGVSPEKIILSGSSAGANLAAAIAPETMVSLASSPKCFTSLQSATRNSSPRKSTSLASHIKNSDNCALTTLMMEVALDACMPHPEPDYRHSPLLADSPDGLPPAFVQCAGVDILCDDAFAYAEALQAADVEVKV
ncbi:hypothetical protein ACJ41O_014966 [Fusarium nematophilum]